MKRSNHSKVIAVLFVFLCSITMGQGIAIGQWREHLPFNQAISITEGENAVYAATPYSVFYYDKSDNSINRLSKVNGLSDHEISTIAYSKEFHALFVAYTNCNLDVIINNRVTNVSDIKRKSINGQKRINRIRFFGPYAYLCCSFGVVQFDLTKLEIKETFIISTNGDAIETYDVDSDGNYWYVAANDGVYKAPLTGTNLLDFQSWDQILTKSDARNSFNNIVFFNNKIYTCKHHEGHDCDTLMYLENNTWHYFDTSQSRFVNKMHVKDDKLVISHNYYVYVYNTDHQITYSIWTYGNNIGPDPKDAFMDDDSTIWIADWQSGIVKNTGEWRTEIIIPNGPASVCSFDMAVGGGKLWVTSGGMDESWNNVYLTRGFYTFQNEEWNSNSYRNMAALDSIRDVLTIAINPSNSEQVYIGTWGRGLMEFTGSTLNEIYTEKNSSLQEMQGIPGFYWVGTYGLCFDSEGNLWVSNSLVSNLLSVKKVDGTWKSFGFGSTAKDIRAGRIVIDKLNQKWMVLPRGQGLIVFNDGGTIDDTSDDHVKKLTNQVGNGALPSMSIFTIAVDHDGEVWVGTDLGIAVFYSPENVFSEFSFDAQQILVEEDGIAQNLLETEVISDIEIDGANRKWISTLSGGVFLMSPDGTEQIEHFTTDNSPLFSNTVGCIAIDDISGEVYFGTDKGILSYRGTATSGETEYTEVFAYPNPVRETYSGVVAIKGLVTNSDIKITDVSGNLIYETVAEGGQAVWDCKNYDGERAKTGVYLVFCANHDGTKSFMTKILIIN
ncbi:MAG: hypothetical protein KKA07_08520 [Bacteroidetes bacterium]|nr:hypothetical protein [Bacteroidota bacterium]